MPAVPVGGNTFVDILRKLTDGHEDDPDAPSRSYAFIKSLDPYHPISLCLNCQNYYFQNYTAGTDIILADIYPVGTNTSYSTKYRYVNADCS